MFLYINRQENTELLLNYKCWITITENKRHYPCPLHEDGYLHSQKFTYLKEIKSLKISFSEIVIRLINLPTRNGKNFVLQDHQIRSLKFGAKTIFLNFSITSTLPSTLPHPLLNWQCMNISWRKTIPFSRENFSDTANVDFFYINERKEFCLWQNCNQSLQHSVSMQ